MTDQSFLVLIAMYSVACAFYTAWVANAKGYNAILWLLGGLFFHIFALIAAAGLPDRKKN